MHSAGAKSACFQENPLDHVALLLVAHGSRQAEANADLFQVAAELRRRGHAVVEPAFLELSEPTIQAAAARCASQGATTVILVPFFLAAGVHVRRDLTDARDQLAQQYPTIKFPLADPLGSHPLLLEIVEQRVRESLATKKNEPGA